MIEVPFNELSKTTLDALIQEYVTRDGTDYGEHEVSLNDKARQVLNQLKSGDVVIVYDEKSESVDLVCKDRMNDR